jgi:chromosome segregation protein
MLYLDSIVVHNFKSFKHTSVKFKNGFNCIVGPNGSGKSNVVDAILFALGESSLRRMRISKMGQLINSSAKKRDDGAKRAYVKLVFSGDSNVEITRAIKSNGKVGYKINGKNTTRQEVLDFLRSYKSSSDETNVIAQGEINRMQNLNPRERRELIDVAAGIREFDEKKDASLKELEKVDTKIREAQIEFGMKKGFVSELEKQKEDAEAYISFKDYVTRGNYTILKTREVEVSNQFDGANRDIKAIDERIARINGELLKLEGSIAKLDAEKAVHIKELNEKSTQTVSATRRMDEVGTEIAVKEAQTKSIKDRVKEREAAMEAQISALGDLKEKLNKGEDEIDRIKEVLKSRKADKGMERMAQLAAQGGTNALLELYSKTQKEIAALQEKLAAVSSAALTLGMEVQGFEKELQEIANGQIISKDEGELNGLRLAELKKASDALEKEVESVRKQLAAHVNGVSASRKKINEIDSKALLFKEQLAMSGASQNTRADDELKKTLKTGFYGRAQDLCTYDDKYGLAVNAAAANRMNYFVVDSAEVAERAIETLKAKQLGRAAFIPLNDIVVNDRAPSGKLDALIAHVSFDDRFTKAFRYIFSDTYVVDSIADAKKAGFGKGRFVTYGGELVESSGVISGGDLGGKRMTSVMLQSKLRALEKERTEAADLYRASETGADAAKKALSEIEAKVLSNSFESERAEEARKAVESRIKELAKRDQELKKQLESAQSKRKQSLEEKEKRSKEVERLGRSAEETLRRSKASEGPNESREKEIAEYKALMEEIEKLKIKLAETQKETDMQRQRSSQIDAEVAEARGQIKEDQRRLAVLDDEITSLSKMKVELNEEIRVKGAKHGALLAKMKDLDDSMAKSNEQKGRHIAEMSKAEREVSEVNIRKAQSQQRLSDIGNELASYQNVEPIIGEKVEQIEEKVARSKFEIEKLGAVNLKAPEVYREKSAELEKAEEKMGVLGSEKDAILNLIKEIDARKLSVFKDTFNQVNDSFKRLHDYIFGGTAQLQLDSGKDPLEAGLNIVIEEGSNKNMHIEQFSGGEKALLILILLFSIQMRKPQSFYLFDEIDAALDKENAKKLSKLLGELSKSSQLIVVSHNDTMITSAETAIGVVRRAGESAVVGLQMSSGGTAEKGA